MVVKNVLDLDRLINVRGGQGALPIIILIDGLLLSPATGVRVVDPSGAEAE